LHPILWRITLPGLGWAGLGWAGLGWAGLEMLITRVHSIRRWLPLSAALPTIQFSAISALALAAAMITVACGSSGGDSGSSDDCGIRECKLTASDAAGNDHFGSTVAVSGDLIVVAAWLDDAPSDNSGSAYVFRFDGTDWVEEQKLTASDAAAEDLFGRSVAISGDLIVVGSLTRNGLTSRSGAAYVYRFDGADWVEEQKLTASDAAAGVVFGTSVSISGDMIVVGAGSTYVFRFDGTEWVEEQKLTASDAAGVDAFGLSVAVAGDVIVVGAFKDGVLGLEFGAAYVYRFDGADWLEERKLTASDIHSRDFFGFSVAVSGDVIVVGADGNDDDGPDSGSAYVFGFDGTDWVEEQKLTASDAAAGDGFGGSVSILGETIVAGATGNSGAAYVFRFDGTDWVEEQKLTASDADSGDGFGRTVAISGEVIVVGAEDARPRPVRVRTGAAYVFRE